MIRKINYLLDDTIGDIMLSKSCGKKEYITVHITKNCVSILVLSILLLSLVACGRSTKTEISVEEQILLKEQKIPTIENLYFLPESIDVVLNAEPDIIEELRKNDTALQTANNATDLDVKEEIKKYLTRKKVYDKTSIFLDIP